MNVKLVKTVFLILTFTLLGAVIRELFIKSITQNKNNIYMEKTVPKVSQN